MSLEGMMRKARRQIKKRDAKLAKQGTTAGEEARKAAQLASSASKRQLSATARWAIQNPDLAAYDNDGNPVDKSVWFD